MELAQQGSLYQRIKSKGVIGESESKKYFKQIVKAIDYLHSQTPSILHWDLKPENVLIQDDCMKLCDFGWSNLNNELDRRNTYCGTPDYLAPEMIKGDTHN